jgi:hypothetical protein
MAAIPAKRDQIPGLARPQPLLTLTLESRQARRLELIERLQPGAARPWQ